MKNLIIGQTIETPEIEFNFTTGEMSITGRSIPALADEFWNPVLHWFINYCESPAASTTVKINLEYFNISSSKKILHLLYKLNELNKKGLKVQVEWHYRENDEDMYEAGEDYRYMLSVPFNFVCYDDSELVLAS